jgi:Leucine-rich repeat (LRR) protein
MEIKYLMVRGTDVTTIPEFITKFKNLKTLRIENCPLTKLPVGLKSMTNLRELGLCDTQLTDLNPKIFPKKLKRLNFSGTDSYKKTDLEKFEKVIKKNKGVS